MKTMIESCQTKILTSVRYLMLFCLMPLCAWAANRTLTIEAPSSVQAGQNFVVPNYASTDAGDGEQVGFFHAQYSTDGGANWTWFAGDVNAGTFVTRHAYITAGAAGSTVIVRTRIAFRGGNDGDVDYNGSGIDWGGSWDNWQSPPTRYAYINVNAAAPISRELTISAPASVNAGESFTVPTFASTDAIDGEQIGFFHGQYSTDGGGSWTGFAGDVNAGASATRHANITASYGGSTVIVRVKIAYRGGGSGDVDFNGSGIDWGGSWDGWQIPPTKYAYIDVTGTLPPTPGELWAVGDNQLGQFGIGNTTSSISPVPAISGVGIFSAGGYHTLFLKTDNTLWAMGQNFYGQLGDGTVTNRSSPVLVTSGVTAVAAGAAHSLFVKSNGTLCAMGSNSVGQLGDGSTATHRRSPVQVATGVISVSAGDTHSLFVKTGGTLWAMGSNSVGQLGDGTTANRISPVMVTSGAATSSAGSLHTMFVKTDGTLWAVGKNDWGQLGDGTTTSRISPVMVASDVATVAAGSVHTVYLKTDGTLWSMGANLYGQLGDGTNSNRPTPVQIASGVASISAGGDHTSFVKTDGTLWAMGYNAQGQLGDGTTTNRSSPVQIASGVAAVDTSTYYTLFRY